MLKIELQSKTASISILHHASVAVIATAAAAVEAAALVAAAAASNTLQLIPALLLCYNPVGFRIL